MDKHDIAHPEQRWLVDPSKLRATRMLHRLTLKDVAHAWGVSVPYVSDLEHGRRTSRFTAERMDEMADALVAVVKSKRKDTQ